MLLEGLSTEQKFCFSGHCGCYYLPTPCHHQHFTNIFKHTETLNYLLIYLFVFGSMWTRLAETCYVAVDNVQFLILLPLSHTCWDYSHAPPCLAYQILEMKVEQLNSECPHTHNTQLLRFMFYYICSKTYRFINCSFLIFLRHSNYRQFHYTHYYLFIVLLITWKVKPTNNEMFNSQVYSQINSDKCIYCCNTNLCQKVFFLSSLPTLQWQSLF